MRRRSTIALLGVVCAGLLGVVVYVLRTNAPENTVAASLSGIEACNKEPDSVACTRPFVKKLLEVQSGSKVMDAIAAQFTPAQCHYIGHVVGQQMYAQYENVETALSLCNRTCDSACVHGIVGEAFAEELGFKNPDEDTDIDLEHMSSDELRTIGHRLCNSLGACHGVGHTLFQVFKKFEPAFAVCRDITSYALQQCYNGVTMEYADILSSRNMRAVPGVAYPDPESLYSLCMFPQLMEERACFRYFPRMASETLKQQNVSQDQSLQRVQKICESYKSLNDRTACFAGIGSYLSYEVLKDPHTAAQSCERLSTPLDQAACTLGRITIATEDRREQLAAYCAAISDVAQKTACYQDLFYSLNRAQLPIQEIGKKSCENDNEPCKAGLKKYALDSWEEIKKTFAH